MVISSLLGLFAVLAASFIRKTADKYEDVCVGVAIPTVLLLLLPFGVLSGHLRPATLDGALRVLDKSLWLDGFALARFCFKVQWPIWVLEPVYTELPLVLAIAWIVTKSHTLLRACVIGAVLAFPLYLLVPAAGPGYAFPNWPQESFQMIQPDTMFPRNCFPSMHLTWALLLALNMKGAWRWPFGIYSALMSLAVVVAGQHYFVDVIAAIPFTFAVQKLALVASPRTTRGESYAKCRALLQ